mmetsp:Transcript_20728/g.44868  ORF Transcript_20728/g.44868 Transcript_20728/m.44868 type:complete len:209 (+) Transcript_20728:271-897(+)
MLSHDTSFLPCTKSSEELPGSGGRSTIADETARDLQRDASLSAFCSAGRKMVASSAPVLELGSSNEAPLRGEPRSEIDVRALLGVPRAPAPLLGDLKSLSDRISFSYSSTWRCKTSMASVNTRFSSLRLLNSSADFTSAVWALLRPIPLFLANCFSNSDNRAFVIATSLDREERVFSNCATLDSACSSRGSFAIACSNCRSNSRTRIK